MVERENYLKNGLKITKLSAFLNQTVEKQMVALVQPNIADSFSYNMQLLLYVYGFNNDVTLLWSQVDRNCCCHELNHNIVWLDDGDDGGDGDDDDEDGVDNHDDLLLLET